MLYARNGMRSLSSSHDYETTRIMSNNAYHGARSLMLFPASWYESLYARLLRISCIQAFSTVRGGPYRAQPGVRRVLPATEPKHGHDMVDWY